MLESLYLALLPVKTIIRKQFGVPDPILGSEGRSRSVALRAAMTMKESSSTFFPSFPSFVVLGDNVYKQ